jgi:signal transduction histidine kinase
LVQTQSRRDPIQQRRIRSEIDVKDLMANISFGLVALRDRQELSHSTAANNPLTDLRSGRAFELPADWQRCGDSNAYRTGRGKAPRVIQVDWLSAPNLPTQWMWLEDMTASKNGRDSSERKSRLAAMGRMTAMLAHQLRTPLCRATRCASMLVDSGPEKTNHPLTAQRLVHQLDTLVVRMLIFVKSRKRAHEMCEIEPLLRARLEIMVPLMAYQKRLLLVNWQAPICLVVTDQMRLGSAILALLENALQHAPEDSTLELGVQSLGHRLEITVADRGPGVSALLLPRLFEPFTTDHATGLGLTIARAAAQAHGGKFTHEAVMPQGARFMLRLPALANVGTRP